MTPLWAHPELPELLAADLAELLPASNWRREFAPPLAYCRHAGPASVDARFAAVAIVLCREERGWTLPLTLRGGSLSRHSGQVSLPGGLVDGDETSRDAAARELGEELGICPPLCWLGDLAPLFVYASNSLVTPCVAAVDQRPAWLAQPPEVDRILSLSLRELMTLPQPQTLEVRRGPLAFSAPMVTVDGEAAWGATAMLLGELRGRLRRIAERLVTSP